MATRRRRAALGWLALAALLAGCSVSRQCQSTGPSGRGSTASDAVLSMALDHSVYAPGSEIPVTLTNRSGGPVSVLYLCQPALIGSPRDECPSGSHVIPVLRVIAVSPGGAHLPGGDGAAGDGDLPPGRALRDRQLPRFPW